MMNGYPTEEDLFNRITRNLTWRNSSDATVLLWHGYLGGLLEYGLIELDVFDRLKKHLPKIGAKEIYELMIDEPIPIEREREIDEYLKR